MFEWIQDHSLLEYSSRQERLDFGERSRFRMNSIKAAEPAGMTALAQYFTAGSVLLHIDFNITVPVPDEEILQRVMREVAPHFEVVNQLVRGGRVESVHLNQLKPRTAELFHQTKTGVITVMKDLYRHDDSERWYSGHKRSLIHYTVNAAELEPYGDEEIKELQTLLHRAYFGGEAIDFGQMPLGWQFEDSLRHSAALRFIAGFAPNLSISVDKESNEVIILNITDKKPVHKLYLKTAQPQPPRRVGPYLYLDAGHRLVYVVNLLVQPLITEWEGFADARLYYLDDDTAFADFDPEKAERLEGTSLFFDQETVQRLMEMVNRELRQTDNHMI
ncbi:hypothetical protein [Paenibacillus typhae]|uniref:Uncharacterized protein n=2 Tax=Paenibacillus typhae TaxID=1174501 RepID=A0A1G8TBT0_9BACL|nr:hypothetical protein [Paenibacillus typhae]SDJ39039.1 hypothetical protein SAMN05216192_11671 [Paenibacillus typhae]